MENFGGLNWKSPILKIFERDFSWLFIRRGTLIKRGVFVRRIMVVFICGL